MKNWLMFFALFPLFVPCFSRAEPVAAGYTCNQLGVTQMGADRSSLVTCLQISPVDSALVWKSMTTGGVPIGSIIAWPLAGNPPDMYYWLDCDGKAITQYDYPILFNMVGSHVPDLRGLFLRGLGSQSFSQNNGMSVGTTITTYLSGELGVVQGDAIRNMTGTLGDGYNSQAASSASINENLGSGVFSKKIRGYSRGTGEHPYESFLQNFDASMVLPTANEIRPVNMAVRYLIRARN